MKKRSFFKTVCIMYKAHKRQQALRQVNEARDSFDIQEIDNTLWITCKGVAVQRMPEYASAGEIVTIINDMRRDASQYEWKRCGQ